MKVQDSLYHLIQSLTKSEKRYFKLWSSRHTIGEENNYVILFDFLDQLSEYDESLVFTHFKGEAFLNRFSITKKRLYDAILGALDSFHMQSSVDAQLHKQLHSADILYKKSLYEQSRRVLLSAEKQAVKLNRYAILLEITRRKKQLLEKKGYKQITEEQLQEVVSTETLAMRQLTYISQLWRAKSELFHIVATKGYSRAEEDRNQYDTIGLEVLKNYRPHELDVEACYLYHQLLSAYYFAINEEEKSLEMLSANINHMERHSTFLEEHPESYFSALSNSIYLSDQLGLNKNAQLLLKKLKELTSTDELKLTEDLKIKLFATSNSIELNMLMKRGEFDKAQELIPIIEQGMLHYGDLLTTERRSYFLFQFAVIEMALENYSQALKRINALINQGNSEQGEDIVAFAQIIGILIHLELGNTDLIPYALKNTQRFLKGRNRLFAFEKLILQHCGKLAKTESGVEQQIIWEDVHDQLLELTKKEQPAVFQNYFDFVCWAKAKTSKQPFIDIIRNKYSRELIS